jgi:hypothetical protein
MSSPHQKVGVVVNYCSNDKPFIKAALEQCLHFTEHVVVVYGSHLYDGTPEDTDEYLDFFKLKFPQVKFVKYQVDLTQKNLKGVVRRPTAYYCNLARYLGFEALKNDVDWLFFIDADEVPEGENVNMWLTSTQLDKNNIYKLGNYWYFKLPIFQAATWEDSILLVHKQYLNDTTIFHDNERDGIIQIAQMAGVQDVKRMVLGIHENPMFHHFSWVRSKQGIATKLRTNTHRDDILRNVNIQAMVDHIFQNDQVNDCIHGYSYNHVDNIFNIVV